MYARHAITCTGVSPVARPMLRYLGQTARELRVAAHISPARIAAEVDVSESTIRRFESGRRWPQGGPDATIAVYADQTGTTSWEIWRRALDAWAAAGD